MISLIYVTCPSENEARVLAETLLKERIIGCANILPKMSSIYHWQGKLEYAEETVLILKTPSEKVSSVLDRVQDLHPYDTPCALEIAVKSGLKEYQEWIFNETRPEKG